MHANQHAEYQCAVGHVNGQPVEISYLDNRNTTASHTLLLLHGLFDHKYTWERLFPLLTDQFRLVAPDLLGFGYSSKPRFTNPAEGIPYSPEMITDYLSRFIHALALDHLILVGNSLGGGIALNLLCNTPAMETRISGLVLIDAAGYPQRLPGYIHAMGSWLGTLLNRPLIRRLSLRLGLINWALRRTYRRTFFDPTKVPASLPQTTMDVLHTPDIFYVYQQAARHIQPQQHQELVEKFRQIRQPTLILWGQHDRIIPPLYALRFDADIRPSQLHVLPCCGHAPHLEQPQETARLLTAWATKNL